MYAHREDQLANRLRRRLPIAFPLFPMPLQDASNAWRQLTNNGRPLHGCLAAGQLAATSFRPPRRMPKHWKRRDSRTSHYTACDVRSVRFVSGWKCPAECLHKSWAISQAHSLKNITGADRLTCYASGMTMLRHGCSRRLESTSNQPPPLRHPYAASNNMRGWYQMGAHRTNLLS